MVGAIGVVMVVVAIAKTLLRITAARETARRSGLDEVTATAASLFNHNTIRATYLLDSLRRPVPGRSAGPSELRTEDRLRELARLLDQRLITRAEHEDQRRRILDEL